jgi:hypothetical protein
MHASSQRAEGAAQVRIRIGTLDEKSPTRLVVAVSLVMPIFFSFCSWGLGASRVVLVATPINI